MDARVRSLLYDEPRLYDLVFPDAGDTMGRMCREAFTRYLSAPPRSVLDIGCGTGRLLQSLAATIGECWGVDYAESNVAYARSARPHLTVRQGDMRTVRLGRRFDALTCFGNALSYALTDGDLARTAESFAAHTHPGSLLMVDALNARCYLEGDGFRERIDGSVDTPEFSTRVTSGTSITTSRCRPSITRSVSTPPCSDRGPARRAGRRRETASCGTGPPSSRSRSSPCGHPPPSTRSCLPSMSGS